MFKASRLIVVSALAFIGFSPIVSTSALGNVNDFSIQDYRIDYYLSKDAENRSTLRTVESITAVFPDIDQNHGIERVIPESYGGHKVNLKVESVSDKEGKVSSFATRSVNGNTIVRIGDANTFVHGSQNYTITYTQRDVTNYFEDTASDEFYWDTNGTDWRVPIDALSVRLHLDPKLNAKTKGLPECYKGVKGSSGNCPVTKTDDGFAVTASGLNIGENVSLAVAFPGQTFKPYTKSSSEKFLSAFLAFLAISLLLTLPIAVLLIVIFLVRYSRQSNRTKERRSVIPEYLPPTNASVSVSATILNQNAKVFAAQILDLAVRKYLKIYQTREKALFKPAKYELEIIQDIQGLKAEEKEILQDIFSDPIVGARLDLDNLKNNLTISSKLRDNTGKVTKSINEQYGLRARNQSLSAWFKRAGWLIMVFSIFSLSPWLLTASIVAFISAHKLKPLTDQGLALYQYLQGLKMYIKVAEVDRIKMLQSPEGALKIGSSGDPNDPRQLIKLYEAVLPYAVLFGLETEWNTRIGQYYESINERPSWYVGANPAFNALAFGAALSNFSTVADYASSTYSSSGGSGGGGFSGGGGGGGGGGGW